MCCCTMMSFSCARTSRTWKARARAGSAPPRVALRPAGTSWACPNAHLAHGLCVNKVLVAPEGGITIIFPLQINIEVSQVVALGNSKLFSHLVAFFLPTLQRDGRKKSDRSGRPLLTAMTQRVPDPPLAGKKWLGPRAWRRSAGSQNCSPYHKKQSASWRGLDRGETPPSGVQSMSGHLGGQ